MQEKNAPIGIYNENGKLVGSKLRKDVDKTRDILKTVVIAVMNEKSEVFMIQSDGSAWPSKWGGSCAGFVRKDETTQQAARRTLKRELGIGGKLFFLDERYKNFNGIRRIVSAYRVKSSHVRPNANDVMDSKWVSIKDAKNMILDGMCMPTFEFALFTLP